MTSISEFVLHEIENEKNKETLVAIIEKDTDIPVFLPNSLLKYIELPKGGRTEVVEVEGYRSGGRNVYVPNKSLVSAGIKIPLNSKYGIEIKGAGTRIKDLQHLRSKALEKLKAFTEEDAVIIPDLLWFGDKPVGGQSYEFARNSERVSAIFDRTSKAYLITKTLATVSHNYTIGGKKVFQEIREFYPGFRAQKGLYSVSFEEIPDEIVRPGIKDWLVKCFTNIAEFSYVLLNTSVGVMKKKYFYTLGLIPSKDIVVNENGAKVVDTESIMITPDKWLSYAQAVKFVKDLGVFSYLLTRRFDKDFASELLEAVSNAFSLTNQGKGKHKIISYVNPRLPYLETEVS
ncbi:hypothetical protein [Acidianus sp. HS-5]|uniref:hypothetical protein n=1 Tax=Acidianus sp. HS-5 TaxID=2886040 RepID=UPI001F1D3545|nr:hypothetical protein [Acidianus sp. HS-5]BDC17570.1 hypothetical protein HS5_04600 [Acidianus sp. HS-5]